MAANTPEMFEAHFGVPMTGGVLNTLNTRLDAEAIAFMLEHGEAKVLITDTEFSPTVEKALAQLYDEAARDRHRRCARDRAARGSARRDYEAFIADGRSGFRMAHPADEWNAISLNYTSGTTGNPKGVVYHHRGAYLNALSQHHRLGDAAARRLPVDAADVPLQRLVLPVDDGGERRRQRLPAQGRCEADLRRDPDAQGSRTTAARRSST